MDCKHVVLFYQLFNNLMNWLSFSFSPFQEYNLIKFAMLLLIRLVIEHCWISISAYVHETLHCKLTFSWHFLSSSLWAFHCHRNYQYECLGKKRRYLQLCIIIDRIVAKQEIYKFTAQTSNTFFVKAIIQSLVLH